MTSTTGGREGLETIRVAIRGATGRMGRMVAAALASTPDLRVVATPGRGEDLALVLVDVGIDFTRPDALDEGVAAMLRAGAAVVVGTSGVEARHLEAWREQARRADRPVLVVPNFSLGIVLLQRFAVQASRWFGDVELLEMHHEKKADSPSGTAADTARRIAAARRPGAANQNRDVSAYRGGRVEDLPVHSVRLPGMLAHQVVWFAGPGEVLSLRHDCTDRAAYAPGVMLAIRGVRRLRGVVVGLEHCLPSDEDASG
jgi:4-hydroxy-tetrahydrodipicolinate reductase